MLGICLIFLLMQLTDLLSMDVLCPVSRNPFYSDYHYTLEVYSPNVINEPNTSCILERKHREYRTCPLRSLTCPVIEENLVDAVQRSKNWSVFSFCPFKEALSNKNINSRIIVLGGSVTCGIDSIGCCNSTLCFDADSRRCAWSYQLNHWMRTTNTGNVSVINAASPGTSSVFGSEATYSIMSDIGVTTLSSTDIIILDYSFNDNAMSFPVEIGILERGLEKLIRTLLGMAASAADLPVIVLMEVEIDGWNAEFCYRHVYHRLAKYYGLPIFSYADAILSNNSLVKQAAFHDHLTTKFRRERHPPWHGQLLYADFVGGLLLSEMNKCDANSSGAVATVNNPYVIPPSLAKMNESHMCNSLTPLVKLSHKDLMSHTAIGSYHVERNDTWGLRLDHKNRGGFMIEMSNQSVHGNMHDSNLVFPLGITVGQLKEMKLIIQLQYIKSYVDAGGVSLGLCGAYFRDLDALWLDYKHYRYTLQEVYSVNVNYKWCTVDGKKNDTDLVDFTVKYKVNSRWEENHDIPKLIRKKPRGNQMFKINSVLVCQYDL